MKGRIIMFIIFDIMLNCHFHDSFRYNLFTGCPQARTCTIILRGGAEQFIEETERSLHDAIMIVRRTMKNDAVVAGEKAYNIFGLVFSHSRVQ